MKFPWPLYFQIGFLFHNTKILESKNALDIFIFEEQVFL